MEPLSPPGRAQGQEGAALLGQLGLDAGLGIKGQGSARLACKSASASVSFSCRVSPVSVETVVSFSLEGNISDAGEHQHNYFSNIHPSHLVAKQHEALRETNGCFIPCVLLPTPCISLMAACKAQAFASATCIIVPPEVTGLLSLSPKPGTATRERTAAREPLALLWRSGMGLQERSSGVCQQGCF